MFGICTRSVVCALATGGGTGRLSIAAGLLFGSEFVDTGVETGTVEVSLTDGSGMERLSVCPFFCSGALSMGVETGTVGLSLLLGVLSTGLGLVRFSVEGVEGFLLSCSEAIAFNAGEGVLTPFD